MTQEIKMVGTEKQIKWATKQEDIMSCYNYNIDKSVKNEDEIIAHIDDDNELIIDGEISKDEVIHDAKQALFESGIEPMRWRQFTWESVACLIAGYNPYDDTMTEWPQV